VTTIEARPSVPAVAPDVLRPTQVAGAGRGRGAAFARGAFKAVVSIVVVLVMWVLFLKIFHVSHLVGKNPLDVWRYVVTQRAAGANRTAILHESGTTLRDAFLGLIGGTVAAVSAAIGFHMWRMAAKTFMPVAMILRSVPLVAMTPLIVGVFGQNLEAVTVIAGIVTFFPTLVNVTLALDAAPKESIDLCRAYGASPGMTLRKVQIPTALPALFASLRIACPLAITGALLAEWLATGKGLGYSMLQAQSSFDYTGMWARVVVVTAYAVILYSLVGAVEKVVLRRYGQIAG
jgi:ABC-type nitrate/sulfonate/bicarbonate transport system permease component